MFTAIATYVQERLPLDDINNGIPSDTINTHLALIVCFFISSDLSLALTEQITQHVPLAPPAPPAKLPVSFSSKPSHTCGHLRLWAMLRLPQWQVVRMDVRRIHSPLHPISKEWPMRRLVLFWAKGTRLDGAIQVHIDCFTLKLTDESSLRIQLHQLLVAPPPSRWALLPLALLS